MEIKISGFVFVLFCFVFVFFASEKVKLLWWSS